MADDADLADRFIEINARASRYKSLRDEPDVIAIGECLFCGATVEPGRRWCNAECRDDWELVQ